MKTSIFRRSLSVVAAVCVLATASVVGSVSAAESDNTNYAFNPGFEEWNGNEAARWGMYPTWIADNKSTDAHGGSSAVKVALSETQNYALFEGGINAQIMNTKAAATLTMWVKYTDITGEGFMVGAERKTAGSENANVFSQRYTGGSDGWQQLTVELPATELDITEIVLKCEIATGTGTLLIDDVELNGSPVAVDPDQNYAFNADFEKWNGNEADRWGMYPTWSADNKSTDAHGGSSAVKVTLSETQNYALFEGGITPPAMDTKAAATLTMWVKYTDITGEGFMIGAERKGANDTNANVFSQRYTGSSDGWQQLTLELPATELAITEIVLKCEIATGTGTLLIDDVALKIKADDGGDVEPPVVPDNKKPGVVETGETGTNLITNPGFENGDSDWGVIKGASITTEDTHSGAKAVKAVLGAEVYGMWNNLVTDFDKDAALKVTFWVKLDGVTGEGVEFGVERSCMDAEGEPVAAPVFSEKMTGTSDWKKVTVTVPATEGCYGIVVKANYGAGEGTVYVDDVFVGLADASAQSDNFIANAGFEKGSATEAANWGLAPGWDKVTSPIVTSGVHGGGRAVSITLGEENRVLFQSNKWGMPEMDLKQALVYTAWVKYENVAGNGVYLKVERKAGDEGVADVVGTAVKGSSDGWVQLKLLVPATTEAIDELIVSVVAEAGTGRVLVDDASLKVATAEDLEEKPVVPPATGAALPVALALTAITAAAVLVICKKQK